MSPNSNSLSAPWLFTSPDHLRLASTSEDSQTQAPDWKFPLIAPNHRKLLWLGPPGESSCSPVTLILDAYANIRPFERFFTKHDAIWAANHCLHNCPHYMHSCKSWWMTPNFDNRARTGDVSAHQQLFLLWNSFSEVELKLLVILV